MRRFSDLKLNTKLNLILSSLLFVLFLLTAFLTFRDQQELVQDLALEQGRDVARQVIATTDYMSDVVSNEPATNYGLVPQVVATQVAKRISEGNRYTVRQISLNYRNPDNRPDTYETEQLKAFQGPSRDENYRVVKENKKKVFRYMQPMIAEESCLECHGDYESAPAFIQERYPRDHPSYNYKAGQVLGAVSFTRPMADLYAEIGSNLRTELIYRIGILALVFAAMGLLTRRFIIDPVSSVSTTIYKVATTGDLSERIPGVASQDEVGRLIHNFNEMMEELDRTTLQRQEAENRYRNLIEATPAAIVTFLEDGKIVISNQEAEKLLGVSRQKLLGETFFNFLEDSVSLKIRITDFSQKGQWQESAKISKHSLRRSSGELIDVNIAMVLASNLDRAPMFTALINKVGE